MGMPGVWRNPGAPLHQDNTVATAKPVVMLFSSRNWETSRDRGKDENLPQRALNLRLGQQFNDPQNLPEYQRRDNSRSAGNILRMHRNQQGQNLPAGAKLTSGGKAYRSRRQKPFKSPVQHQLQLLFSIPSRRRKRLGTSLSCQLQTKKTIYCIKSDDSQ